MTDYNAKCVYYGFDQHQWEAYEGTITVDGIECYWRYDAWEYGSEPPNYDLPRPFLGLYQILPKNAFIRTKWRLRDGQKLRRLPFSKRRDRAAIIAAIYEAEREYPTEEPRDDLYPSTDRQRRK